MKDNHKACADITNPQLKSTVVPIPLTGERLALHRGPYKAEHDLLVIDDPGGWRESAIRLMDGTRTMDDIAQALENDRLPVNTAALRRFVEALADTGVIADAEALSTAGLSDDEAARYSRNLNAWAALTADGRSATALQRELGQGHVLMLGVGGLGTVAALALAMAGCGRLSLVDFDVVELQNLNRQLLYGIADLGKGKIHAAEAGLRLVNPHVKVSTLNAKLTGPDQVRNLIESIKPDIVVSAVDRPTVAVDRWINDACFALGIPFNGNSVSGLTGLLWTKIPGETGCFCCDDLWSQKNTPNHYEVKRYREKHDLIAATSAFSFTAMAIGAMIASDVVRYLVKWPVASAGRMILLDFSTLTTLVYERPAHPDCPICGVAPSQ